MSNTVDSFCWMMVFGLCHRSSLLCYIGLRQLASQMFDVYSSFVANIRGVYGYATVAAYLTDIQQKSRVWSCGHAKQAEFETTKSRLLQAPVLIHPDMKKPFQLHTDASEVGIGATLSQLYEQFTSRLVACRSKKLNKAQLIYQVHEKKCSHWSAP